MPRMNIRENRERRYTEAVERQAKHNDKHEGRNMCEKGCIPNHPTDHVEPVKQIKEKKVRKRHAKVKKAE